MDSHEQLRHLLRWMKENEATLSFSREKTADGPHRIKVEMLTRRVAHSKLIDEQALKESHFDLLGHAITEMRYAIDQKQPI